MRYTLKPARLTDPHVYAVQLLDSARPGVLGWLQRLPSGWRRSGYDDDAPLVRSLSEAVYDLIEHDSYEQQTADWPRLAPESHPATNDPRPYHKASSGRTRDISHEGVRAGNRYLKRSRICAMA